LVRPVRQLPIPGLPYCVYLSSECIVVRGPDGTRRLSPRDVVSVKERPVLRLGRDDERKLILVTRDLLHVPLPVGDPKVRWGLKAILAARDGDEDELLRCVRWIVRETNTLPLAELRGETVWFRWSWLELDVGPPDRARKALECAFSSLIEESECWMARFDLMKKASPFKVAISVPMAPILVLLSFGAGGAKAVATKLGAKGKLVAKIASGAAVARLVRSVGRVLGKSLSKVAKTLAKLGVKPTLAKVIATVMTLCFGPLLTMTAVYWWLARRAYGLDPGRARDQGGRPGSPAGRCPGRRVVVFHRRAAGDLRTLGGGPAAGARGRGDRAAGGTAAVRLPSGEVPAARCDHDPEATVLGGGPRPGHPRTAVSGARGGGDRRRLVGRGGGCGGAIDLLPGQVDVRPGIRQESGADVVARGPVRRDPAREPLRYLTLVALRIPATGRYRCGPARIPSATGFEGVETVLGSRQAVLTTSAEYRYEFQNDCPLGMIGLRSPADPRNHRHYRDHRNGRRRSALPTALSYLYRRAGIQQHQGVQHPVTVPIHR